MSDRLGTAHWEEQPVVSERYPFTQGKFWLGRSEDATAIGYKDDRHICIVSGTRGGKGTTIIINNLCFWPGSAVVVDPKGENTSVTAARRGQGSEHCVGLGQAVHVLDPFETAHVEERYRSCFNPLADLDPEREETIDEASRLANAIVVVKDESHEPFWDESARTMVRGIILHVLTAKQFTDDERNMVTVRKLIQRGAWEIADAIRESGQDQTDPPHLLLWRAMELNPAFDGVVAGIGSQFHSMMMSSPKTFQGVLQAVANHTEFLDSPGMRRVLSKSDFKLSELKTRPEGMTLYLSLPQRYMDTHYRWLRMMVSLTTTEMEITRGLPVTGHPVLMVLDEFAGLKRMAAIENAVAQIAGFGVKLLFVLQSLEQLKSTYKDSWETFLSNAGVKAFFSIEDHFTREYISKLAGETEVIRELRTSNQSESENESIALGRSQSEAVSRSITKGTSVSQTRGTSHSVSESETHGVHQSRSTSQSFGWNSSSGWSSSPQGFSTSGSSGASSSTTYGTSHGTSSSRTRGSTFGTSASNTHGRSASETTGTSSTAGTNQTETRGTSRTTGTGQNESVHRRPLIQPDEVGRYFARIDDPSHPGYPGAALVLITGANPLVVKRTNYFQDAQFIDCFSPHPDHKFVPAVTHTIDGIRPLIERLETAMNGSQLTIAQWLIEPGSVTLPGQTAAAIEHVPRDNRTVHILVPYFGKVSATAATSENALSSGEWGIPDGVLFSVRTYDKQDTGIDPFLELWEACRALEVPDPALPVPFELSLAPRRTRWPVLLWAGLLVLLITVVFLLIYNNQSRETERTTMPEVTQPVAPEQKTASTSPQAGSGNAPAPIKARPVQPDTRPNSDNLPSSDPAATAAPNDSAIAAPAPDQQIVVTVDGSKPTTTSTVEVVPRKTPPPTTSDPRLQQASPGSSPGNPVESCSAGQTAYGAMIECEKLADDYEYGLHNVPKNIETARALFEKTCSMARISRDYSEAFSACNRAKALAGLK